MRWLVLLAVLLLGVVASTTARAQETTLPLIEQSEEPLVRMPEYRAPEYDTSLYVLVYVVTAPGNPSVLEADLPFVYTPHGMLVPRKLVPEFAQSAYVPEGARFFVCTVEEAARASFDFAQRASRTAHCVLHP